MSCTIIRRAFPQFWSAVVIVVWACIGLPIQADAQDKPRVTGEPVDLSLSPGASASFRVQVAEGAWSYQWLKNGVELSDGGRISGTRTAALGISNVQISDEGQYSARVSGVGGQTVSQAATLTVEASGPRPPQIREQPESESITAGRDASFSVSAVGSPATFTYQWQLRKGDGTTWNDLANSAVYIGVSTDTLIVNNATTAMNGDAFRCVVGNGVSPNAVSSVALLSVAAAVPPANDAFASRAQLSGSAVSATGYNAGATREAGEPNHAGGNGTSSVWWTWTAPSSTRITISTVGSTFDTLLAVYTGNSMSALTLVAANDDDADAADGSSEVTLAATLGTTYQIVVDGFEGDTGEIALRLSMEGGAPAAGVTPVAREFGATGGTGSFSVSINGTWTAVPSAAWITVQTPSSGAGSGTVNYSVAANTGPTVRSGLISVGDRSHAIAQAAAVPPVGSRLANLSVLAPLAAGETMTMGTVLGGSGTSGTKALVSRAAGPALAQFGVAGVLPDPTMKLVSTSVSPAIDIASNNDWSGSPALSSAFAQVGAFAYASVTSRDAGIFSASLPAGNYTVQVSDASGAAGTVIAEIYDATPANTFTSSTPRLINVAVLKQLGAGLTVGFVIAGSGGKTVLVRAIGPTLGAAPFNVSGAAADPQVTLFSGQSVIRSNDNWGTPASAADASLATIQAAFGRVGAFALPAGSRDAALLVTLEAGSYTAQVRGVGATTGVALVEVYEVP